MIFLFAGGLQGFSHSVPSPTLLSSFRLIYFILCLHDERYGVERLKASFSSLPSPDWIGIHLHIRP